MRGTSRPFKPGTATSTAARGVSSSAIQNRQAPPDTQRNSTMEVLRSFDQSELDETTLGSTTYYTYGTSTMVSTRDEDTYDSYYSEDYTEDSETYYTGMDESTWDESVWDDTVQPGIEVSDDRSSLLREGPPESDARKKARNWLNVLRNGLRGKNGTDEGSTSTTKTANVRGRPVDVKMYAKMKREGSIPSREQFGGKSTAATIPTHASTNCNTSVATETTGGDPSISSVASPSSMALSLVDLDRIRKTRSLPRNRLTSIFHDDATVSTTDSDKKRRSATKSLRSIVSAAPKLETVPEIQPLASPPEKPATQASVSLGSISSYEETRETIATTALAVTVIGKSATVKQVTSKDGIEMTRESICSSKSTSTPPKSVATPKQQNTNSNKGLEPSGILASSVAVPSDASLSTEIVQDSSFPVCIISEAVNGGGDDDTKEESMSELQSGSAPDMVAMTPQRSNTTHKSLAKIEPVVETPKRTTSVHSPQGVDDFPEVEQEVPKAATMSEKFMEIFGCVCQPRTTPVKQKAVREVDISSIAMMGEIDDDCTVGDLTATTHEMRVNIHRFIRQLDQAEQDVLGDKLPELVQPTCDDTFVMTRVENYFEDYRSQPTPSLEAREFAIAIQTARSIAGSRLPSQYDHRELCGESMGQLSSGYEI